MKVPCNAFALSALVRSVSAHYIFACFNEDVMSNAPTIATHVRRLRRLVQSHRLRPELYERQHQLVRNPAATVLCRDPQLHPCGPLSPPPAVPRHPQPVLWVPSNLMLSVLRSQSQESLERRFRRLRALRLHYGDWARCIWSQFPSEGCFSIRQSMKSKYLGTNVQRLYGAWNSCVSAY